MFIVRTCPEKMEDNIEQKYREGESVEKREEQNQNS